MYGFFKILFYKALYVKKKIQKEIQIVYAFLYYLITINADAFPAYLCLCS